MPERTASPGRTSLALERAALTLTALVAAASLTWPFGWDQGIFASVGGVIARGGVPYRDAWDIKGPLTHLVYALSHLLFGPVTWGIRIIDLVIVAIFVGVLHRVASQLGLRAAARVICLGFALWYASGTYWNTAQPDAWAGGCILGAVALLLEGPARSWRYAGAGALVGLTVLVKPHYGVFLVLPALAAWQERHRPRLLVASGAGCLVVVAAATAWLASAGVLDDFVYAYLQWPALAYASLERLSLATAFARLGRSLFPASILLAVAPAVVTGAVVTWRDGTHHGRLLLVWVAVALLAVGVQRRFYGYHWTLAIPPLVLVAAVGLRAMKQATATRPGARAALGVYAVVLAMRLVAHPAVEVAHFVEMLAGIESQDAYERHFGVGGIDLQVARALRARTSPGDTVLMFGPNAGVVYLSGRESPTRFVWNTPVLIGEQTNTFARFRQEYVASLRRHPPRFIVESTVTGSVVPDYTGPGMFPEFAHLLATDYTVEEAVGHLVVHRRLAP